MMIDVVKRELTLSVSQVHQFMDCQMLHFWHYVMQRKGADTSIGARDLGTLFHAGMETWLKEGEVRWALRQRLTNEYDKYNKSPDPKQLNAADVLSERGAWFIENKGHRTWDQVLAVEKPFRIEVGLIEAWGQTWTLYLQGKGDLFCLKDNELWHMQWKTYTPPLQSLTETVLCSLHENLYPVAAEVMYPQYTYGGTMLGSFSKAAKHRKVKGAPKCGCGCDRAGQVLRPAEGEVHVQYLPIDSHGTQRALDTLRVVGAQILRQFHYAETWDPSLSPFQPPPEVALQNEHMCTGRFGNSLCPFRRGPCNGAGPVTDQLVYVTYDPLERYAVDPVSQRGGE
jgi:hypothetical protein